MTRKYAILVFEKPAEGATILDLKPIDAYTVESADSSLTIQIRAQVLGADKHGRAVSAYLHRIF